MIQRPELLMRLQRRLGLKQAHIAPGLGDTVQPVAILEDLSKIGVQNFPRVVGWAGPVGNDGAGLFGMWFIHNPLGSRVNVRVLRFFISHTTSGDGDARITFSVCPNVTPAGAGGGTPIGALAGTSYWTDLSRKGNASAFVSSRQNSGNFSPFPNTQLTVNFDTGEHCELDVSDLDFVLPPDSAFRWLSEESAAKNTSELFVSCVWQEEPLDVAAL